MAADVGDPGGVAPVVVRARTAAVGLLLALLAFLQSPERVAVDTKLDLTVDPVGFLQRALHLWDPQSASGQLQNQATGYLWPMGPFFALGDLLHLPPWVVQRLWWTLLLLVAFTGFRKVAERLGLGTPATRVLLAFGFAVSPRVLGLLGATSVEALPLCMSPWVLLPLVDGAQGRLSARRAALLSGVAVLCTGGVNAVATAAALPPAGLFVLFATTGGRRRALAGWWVLAVTLATLWWVVPLLLLGAYSPPFLQYIESSTVTTGLTSLSEALRGTSDWIGFLATGQGPVWPAAWRLVTDPLSVVDTLLVAGLGLWGLTCRDLPYRGWLLVSVLLGLVLVTLGHEGPLQGLVAGPLRDALDASLAPARNVHKFDAVLRLPLLLAACHAAGFVRVELPRVAARRAGEVLVGLVLVGLVTPALADEVVPGQGYAEVPAYWQQAADFVSRQDVEGRALLLPGSPFADYLWGSTGDEPFQPLASSPWAVRNGIPLQPEGGIRLLDAIDRRLRHGDGSAGLTEALLRSGVGLLVVRNDLDRAVTGTPRAVLLHQALAASPGITRIASFGPEVGQVPAGDVLVDAALALPYPAVEVYQVGDGGQRISTTAAADTVVLAGGPEALLDAADAGLVEDRATTLAGQAAVPGSTAPGLVTDTLRRTEAPFSSLPQEPAPLQADDPFRQVRAAHDYLPVAGPDRQTVLDYLGVQAVRASSSASDVDAFVLPGPQYAPQSAVDGDPTTAWHSGDLGAVGQWLELDLLRSTDVSRVRLALASGAGLSPVSAVTVTTDVGAVTVPLQQGDGEQSLQAVPGRTTSVRVTVAAVRGGGRGVTAGFRELGVDGVLVEPVLRVPAASAGTASFLLSASPVATDGCVRVGTRPLCTPVLQRAGAPRADIDRLLTVPGQALYGEQLTVRSRAGAALDRLLDEGRLVQVSATSRAVPDPAARPSTVVDDDLGTGWVADAADRAPVLTLTWDRPRRLSSVQLVTDVALAASRAAGVTVVADGRSTRVALDDTGRGRFPSVVTDRVELRLDTAADRTSTGSLVPLPVGVSEVVLDGLALLRRPVDRAELRVLPCGSGPDVQVDGAVVRTRVLASVGALEDRVRLPAVACDPPPPLLPGEHHVVVAPAATTEPVMLLLRAGTAAPVAGGSRAAAVGRWDDEHRTVELADGPATVLTVHENTNKGWQARYGGAELRRVVVDGWQQGWLVPAGRAGTVTLTYAPGTTYRAGLVAGGLGVLGLLLLLLLPSRPGSDATRRDGVTRLAVVVAALLLVLLAGPAALAVLLPALAVAVRARRRPWPEGLVAVGLVGAAVAGVARPWPSGRGGQSLLSQAGVLVALAAVVGAAALTAWRRPSAPTEGDGGPLDEHVADG